jgi:hypothetical protein
MKRSAYVIPAAIAACAVGFVSTANAQATTTGSREMVEAKPNTDLIASGIFTIGIPYVASAAVATQSEHPGDDKLFIPVAGPWLDLLNRGSCGGVNETLCDTETFYKVLLVGDGVLQGIGALEVLGGLVFPDSRPIGMARRPTGPSVRVSPAPVGRTGYGIGAVGTF